MSKKTSTNQGQRVYSQAEYEHLCFAQEPFSGYVEGIGYTCTEIVVTARALNKSGTEFMFDINLIGYTFDMREEGQSTPYKRNSHFAPEEENKQPDRSDYLNIPTFEKAEYRDDNWKWVNNPLAFVNNVAVEIVNPLVELVNGIITSPQVLYQEGAGAWWEFEWGGFKNQIKGIGNWFAGSYDYVTKTPAKQQWADFKSDISNPESWEKSTALGVTLFSGAGAAGMTSKSAGMLTKIPSQAVIPSLGRPLITTSDGFLLKGLNVKSPFNIPVQRFGQMSLNGPDFWGIRLGSSKFTGRYIFSIKTEWNSLTQFTTGEVLKNSQIKVGIVGPQNPIYKYPGGGIQIIVKSKEVVKQSTKIVNTKK